MQMIIPVGDMPIGTRELITQPAIQELVQKQDHFDGSNIYDYSETLTRNIENILPLYNHKKISLRDALHASIGHCAHRAAVIELVASQTPHVVSAMLIKAGHAYNIIQSATTYDSVVIENDMGERVGDVEDDIREGIFLTYPIYSYSDVIQSHPHSVAVATLRKLSASTDATIKFARIKEPNLGLDFYKIVEKGQQVVSKETTLQFVGLAAMRYIERTLT